MKKVLILITMFFISITKINAYYKLPIDPTTMTIDEINLVIDQGIITYTDLMNFYLERINEYNSQYNAFISINENALKEAEQKTKEFNESGRTSPIFGLPIILKDNIDYIGLPTTVGSKALLDSYPKENSYITQKLIDAGAIIIGKANLSSFCLYANNSKSEFGHTYNAYNINYSSYGSSGGVAVAVAGNLAVAGIGTDTNSSIRIPASANNVIGLRPTFNSISTNGIVNYDTTRDVVGPITRYVSDNIILYNIISDNNITYDNNIQQLKIGVLSQLMTEDKSSNVENFTKMNSEIKTLTENAIKVFKENQIVYIDYFYNSYYENLVESTYSGRVLCDEFNKYIINTTSILKSFQEVYKNSNIPGLETYYDYCDINFKDSYEYNKKGEKQQEYNSYIEKLMDDNDVDVFIYPAMRTKVYKIAELNTKDLFSNSYLISPTTGMPSLVMPMGFDKEGLSYGIEFITKKGQEQILYDIANYFETKANYYYNPEIAPLLYEIPENVQELIKLYTKNINNNYYLKTNNLVKDYFKNYNNIENIENEANLLIQKYSVNQKINSCLFLLILSIILYCLLKK